LNAPPALWGARDASAGAQVGIGGVPRLEGVGVGKVSAGSWVFRVWKVSVSGRCREETEGVGGMISPDCCWSGRPSGWCWWLIGCDRPGWCWWLINPGRHRCSGRLLLKKHRSGWRRRRRRRIPAKFRADLGAVITRMASEFQQKKSYQLLT
jgi:hypothetical protein